MSGTIVPGELLLELALLERIGGKGMGLVQLAKLGLPVPAFSVLTTKAWEQCDEGRAPLPVALRRELVEAWQALGGGPLAVRSSAVAEDGGAASWAGQLDSTLGAEGPAALSAAVERAWASGRGERALAYAAMRGTSPGPVAVVLQRLVQGEVSGVLFSRDPEQPDVTLISAGPGLGEGVVQGRIACDTFRVGGAGEVEAEIALKDEEILLVDGALRACLVPAERASAPCLSEDQARELAHFGRLLERELGVPVDVEFTVAGGAISLLQVRPITAPMPMGGRLLWDNSNIVESYSGVTTPLTFSFASRAYTIVYQLFSRVMGVDPATVRANEPTYRRMIGLVRGRIFYNLNAWYKVLSLLPGFSFNKAAMETMMGVSEVASDQEAGVERSRLGEGLSLLRLLGRLGWRLLRLESDARVFRGQFVRALAAARARDPYTLRPDELLQVYERAERELLWAWTPPLVNDFFTMIFYKLLQKTAQQLTGDPETQLHNLLLAGDGALASAAPARELAELAVICRDSDILSSWLSSPEEDALVLREALRHDLFRSRWDRWFERYGDRSPDELKLEAPTLRDTPHFVLQALRAQVRSGAVPDGAEERARRQRAEAEWRRLNRGLLGKAWRAFVLRQARRRVAMREALRLERTRVFGLVRDLFRALADRLVEGGHLGAREDVFYLTVEELLGFVRGTTVTVDLMGLVAVRRAEFDGWRATPAPADRFTTWGAVHLHNRFAGKGRAAAAEGDRLVGTASSAGVVTAPARLVLDPREVPDLGGGLLVAHRTDPGWVPLFASASGILVERGSLLSHSAVVARELGLPAIVGLGGLMDWAREGEVLCMDGSTGVVRRGGDV
ncbi:MAG: hypothetical protein JXX28_04775 [Deltaproteobacteria bacterium]|nr:hypothetical protein [Deltaproteobacteria bacterium]